MIVVAVSDYDTLYLFFLHLEVCGVGNDVVYAWSFLFRELKTHVDYQYFILVFEKHQVSTDFFKTSQSAEANRLSFGRFFYGGLKFGLLHLGIPKGPRTAELILVYFVFRLCFVFSFCF